MNEVQIEMKNGFIHQHEELQVKNESMVASSSEDANILSDKVHIKDELIDQGFILPSAENTKFMSPSICPMLKQEVTETNTNAKAIDDHEKPPVELQEKEKQYNCGICHEAFDEVPLFKAHARSVHAGHKAPFFTISFKETAKSLEAPTISTPVKGQLNSE